MVTTNDTVDNAGVVFLFTVYIMLTVVLPQKQPLIVLAVDEHPPAYTYPHDNAIQGKLVVFLLRFAFHTILMSMNQAGSAPQKLTTKPSLEQPTIYNYVNPATGQHVASLLPPDHPEMICLQAGSHVQQTRFGLLGKSPGYYPVRLSLKLRIKGVLAAIFWFPLGVGLALMDRRVKCRRCGLVIENGITCG